MNRATMMGEAMQGLPPYDLQDIYRERTALTAPNTGPRYSTIPEVLMAMQNDELDPVEGAAMMNQIAENQLGPSTAADDRLETGPLNGFKAPPRTGSVTDATGAYSNPRRSSGNGVEGDPLGWLRPIQQYFTEDVRRGEPEEEVSISSGLTDPTPFDSDMLDAVTNDRDAYVIPGSTFEERDTIVENLQSGDESRGALGTGSARSSDPEDYPVTDGGPAPVSVSARTPGSFPTEQPRALPDTGDDPDNRWTRAREGLRGFFGVDGNEDAADQLGAALMRAGAGLASGSNWSEGIANALSEGTTGFVAERDRQREMSLEDEAREMERQDQQFAQNIALQRLAMAQQSHALDQKLRTESDPLKAQELRIRKMELDAQEAQLRDGGPTYTKDVEELMQLLALQGAGIIDRGILEGMIGIEPNLFGAGE